MAKPLIVCRDLSIIYNQGKANEFKALQGVSTDIFEGEYIILFGPSGCGKSTLMYSIQGSLPPGEGTLLVKGDDVYSYPPAERVYFQRYVMGIIFQQFNLVPYLNPLDNVLLPCRLSQKRRARALPTATAEATFLLSALGIADNHWRRPVTRLSVGQQQRVAAARALIGTPELILADEPTSALDTDNRDRFIELLLQLAAKQQSSVVFVSHDQSLAGRFDHQIALKETP
jgi:putative ABC transport system ATP-binding protein